MSDSVLIVCNAHAISPQLTAAASANPAAACLDRIFSILGQRDRNWDPGCYDLAGGTPLELSTATNIAEIITSLGVVISLIFVAREFRRNTRNASLDSIARALQTQVHQFAHLADEPEKADRLRRALSDFDSLSQGEKGQVSAVIHDMILSHDVLRRAHESGLMAGDDFRVMQELWASLMRTKGGRQWWEGWRSIMPARIVSYVDSVIDDPSLKVKPLYDELPWLFALAPESVPGRTETNLENAE